MSAHFIRNFLKPEHIVPRLLSSNKNDAIRELILVLAETGALANPQDSITAVCAREKAFSTCFENGIALPHVRSHAVNRLTASMGFIPAGIDFDAADGQSARVILLTVYPMTGKSPGLRFMSGIKRILEIPHVLEKALAATSSQEIIDILCSADDKTV